MNGKAQADTTGTRRERFRAVLQEFVVWEKRREQRNGAPLTARALVELRHPLDSASHVVRIKDHGEVRDRSHRIANRRPGEDEDHPWKGEPFLHSIVGEPQKVLIVGNDNATARDGLRELAFVGRPQKRFVRGRLDIDASAPKPGHRARIQAFVRVQTKRHSRLPGDSATQATGILGTQLGNQCARFLPLGPDRNLMVVVER